MIPLRFTGEILGAKVGWIDGAHEIIVTKDDVRLELKRGSNTGKKTIIENGIQKQATTFSMDSPPTFDQGRIVLPFRVIGENLGCFVHWDDNYHIIIVNETTLTAAEISEQITIAKRLYGIN